MPYQAGITALFLITHLRFHLAQQLHIGLGTARTQAAHAAQTHGIQTGNIGHAHLFALRTLLALLAAGLRHGRLAAATALHARRDGLDDGTGVEAAALRGGAALVIAGLSADGVTEVSGVKYIDRGYESIEGVLSAAGASVRLMG